MIIRCLSFILVACMSQNVNAAKMPELPYPIEQQLSVEIVLTQQEWQVDVQDSSAVASQFGLIGALIGYAVDSTAKKNSEHRIVKVRDVMDGYNFNQQFETATRSAITTPGISLEPEFKIIKSTFQQSVDMVKPRPAQVLTAFVITPRYSISQNFEQVAINLDAKYVARALKPNGSIGQSIIFSRSYRFNIPMDAISGSQATADANRWVALGKEQLTELANQGIKQVTDMLAFDFSKEGRAVSLQSIKGQEINFKGKVYKGRVLRQTEDFIWVQSGKGRTQTIQGYQPITGKPFGTSIVPAITEQNSTEMSNEINTPKVNEVEIK